MQGHLKESLIRLQTFVADTLFPKSCIGCGAPETYLCDACLARLPKNNHHRCPFCPEETPYGETCLRCAKKHSLDGLFSAFSFRENETVADAIHALKYEFVSELASPLGRILANAAAHSEIPLPDMLVPVPLHPWRQRFRGFNQSTLIARSVSGNLTPPVPIVVNEDLIVRKRFTLPQAKSRGAEERRANLTGAFSLKKGFAQKTDIRGKTIWLVDDVATTGSTLEVCAQVLKKAGAKKIIGVVVAR